MGQGKSMSDSKADAIAAVVLIMTVVATVVFWLSQQ